MKNFLLLLARLGGVSAIFFLSISVLLKYSDKDTVASFINALNNVILVSGFASLGFHSILMYYSARSERLLRWALIQMVLCLPIAILTSVACSFLIEAVHATLGVAWIAMGGLFAAIAASLPGGLLGAGRYKEFTTVEIVSSVFFLLFCLGAAYFSYFDGAAILALYIGSLLLKIALYIVLYARADMFGQFHGARQGSRHWRRISLPLFVRFLGPAWLSGNFYAAAYRLMLAIFQMNPSINQADVALVWSIVDRVQNILQTLNVMIYRAATKSRNDFQRVRSIVDIAYFPLAGAAYAFVGVAIHMWAGYVAEPIDWNAFYLIVPLLVWGYRSLQQNLLSAQRLILQVAYDLVFVLTGWLVIAYLAKYYSIEWFWQIGLMCGVISASAVNLRLSKVYVSS